MKYKKTIMLGIILLTIVMISGVTFALWQITLKQESTNVITTGCFRVEFQDENPISLNNAFPITDEEGKKLIPYTFTITNTCESYASYQINLEVLNDTTLENLDYLKIMVEDNIDLLNKKETVSKTLENATTSRKLETGYLDANGSKTYHLRLWMSENTPTDEAFMNKIFNSKVTIIATYQTEFDYDKPMAVLNATKENGSLIIDASASTDNTSIKNYYYSLDGENWISSKNNTHEFQEDRKIEYGTGTSAITSLYNSTIHKVYLKVEDEYGNMSEIVSTDFLDELEYDDTSDNNLRYIGANPNNYVSFNNELWRIIGVMENIDDGTGKKESRIKLIRDESIGEYSWDSSPSSINSGHGVNEWTQADAMKLMNPGYESESIGGSLYWNKESGTCFSGEMNQYKNCSFQETGLDLYSKEMIENVKWNTGTYTNSTYMNLITADFYEFERSSNILTKCTNASYCNDTVTRTSSWIGKIALMYPSDYGYATSGGITTDRKECLQYPLYKWDNSNVSDCKNNNWFIKIARDKDLMYTLTPINFVSDFPEMYSSIRSFMVYTNGRVYGGVVRGSIGNEGKPVFPSLYLKHNIKITKGIGTEEDPFELSL